MDRVKIWIGVDLIVDCCKGTYCLLLAVIG